MQLIQFNGYQELKPRWKYLTNKEETEVVEGLCATEIDTSEYKDISTEKAEEILKKLEEENNDGEGYQE